MMRAMTLGLGNTAAGVRGAARARLAQWLVEGPAQQRGGAHAGAVAGSIDSASRAVYVYPEITGYFLQWLAWRGQAGDARDTLVAAARAAQAWIARWAAAPVPATRVYLEPTRDWRNGALFCFDVAMVLRGLASATQARLVVPDAALVERLAALLLTLRTADDTLAACRPQGERGELPPRWSTRDGPFLAKAAAGVLAASGLPGMSGRLVECATRTFDNALGAALDRPHAETHPALYALEGLLARVREPRVRTALPLLAERLTRLLDASGPALPESTAARGAARLDIRAQALRGGVLLRALDVRGAPSRRALEMLADDLARRVMPAGGLPFAVQVASAGANVWTAMFAEQGLALIDAADPARYAACIV